MVRPYRKCGPLWIPTDEDMKSAKNDLEMVQRTLARIICKNLSISW